MNLIRCLNITHPSEAIHQMEQVGVDAAGMELMKGKTLHFNFKIEGIDPRTANLLKQEMLSLGGDVALDGRGLDCSVQSTDAILIGNQKQFEKLESGGVVYSTLAGRTRLYAFNPRYPFLQELKALLEKALSFYPEEEREELLLNRRRPRRQGKPL